MCNCPVEARIIGSLIETDEEGGITDVLMYQCPVCNDRYERRIKRETSPLKKTRTRKKKGE